MFKDDDEEEENTFGVTRYPCMPSLVALQQMRNRLHLAFLGRKLMKWTALATGRELRRLAQELYEVYDGFAEDLRNAFILLARSRYFCPSLNSVVCEDIGKKAGVLVQQCGRTVSGVKIVQFEIFETEYPPYPHLGLEKGGQTILETKKAWLELLKRLIMMMQLRAGFLMVELANRNANKKWNVLSKMVIPRVNLSCHYITSELEEIEREDNFRLKRFKELKIKKQRAKEKKMVKTILEESESTTCSCKSCIVIPEKDKISVRSTYKDKINIIVPKIEKPDSKTISSSNNKIKSIEFIDQRELNRKDSNRSNKCCQVDSDISTPKPKYKDSETVCPTCNIQVKLSSKEYSSSCTGIIPGVDTSTEPDVSPTSQNQEAEPKSVKSTCSCFQLANVKLPSDKDIKLVSSDKSCNTNDTEGSKLKKKENKPSCESICKGDERKPEEKDKDNQNFIESVKEIKIRKLKDKDGNVRVEKRVITTTYENKIPLSKCCSESDMYKKPSYAGTNRTVKISKSKLKGKRNQTCIKPCGSASTEVSKAPPSVTVCCDTDRDDQEVQNKSNHSTSQSASVASVDYSCSDKTVSACNSCSESKPPEEAKTTQTCGNPNNPDDTKTENEKPKCSYCTVKIFAKTDAEDRKDEGCNSIELTPSMLDLLKKLLEQAKNIPVSSNVVKPPISPACDCSTMASGILKQKSICSTEKPSIPINVIEMENTQGCSCQKKPEQNIQDKEEGVQFTPPSETGSVEIVCSNKKDVSTETVTGSIRKRRSEPRKHSCGSKADVSNISIIKKENSVCSCKSKKSIKDNTELKCPCSKSQNAPPEQKSCTCSKVESEEKKCKCDSKKETIKPPTSDASKLACICNEPKPDLDPNCCNKPEAPNSASKSIKSTDSKICSKVETEEKKCICNSKQETTKPLASSALKQACICNKPKPDLDPNCCNKPEAPNSASKSIKSTDSKICSKVETEEKKCICNSKQETTKPLASSALKQACICNKPKPDLDPNCCNKPEAPNSASKSIKSTDSKICSKVESKDKKNKGNSKKETSKLKSTCICNKPKPDLDPKLCNKCKAPDTASKSIESTDSKISKCVSIHEPENNDYPETKDMCTQKESHDSCCSQKKPKPDIKTVSVCSLCGQKDASTLTRRSDRYDVRPLRLLNLRRTTKVPWPSLSDSVIVTNKRLKNTRLRRCISYCDTPPCKRF